MTSYTLDADIGASAALGLIVLQTDETIEQDFRRLFPTRDVALFVSRVPSGTDVTTETLGAMADAIPTAASLLPPGRDYDVVAYGCTSGATVIGPEKVVSLVQGAARASAVTDPLTAVIAALRHVGARRIGMLTPYIASVTQPMRTALEAAGFEIAALASFEEAEEVKVARIAGSSLVVAVEEMRDVDAVFMSCTNLRTLDVIAEIEAMLNVPVISSNTALAWHMGQLSGARPGLACGKLLTG